MKKYPKGIYPWALSKVSMRPLNGHGNPSWMTETLKNGVTLEFSYTTQRGRAVCPNPRLVPEVFSIFVVSPEEDFDVCGPVGLKPGFKFFGAVFAVPVSETLFALGGFEGDPDDGLVVHFVCYLSAFLIYLYYHTVGGL